MRIVGALPADRIVLSLPAASEAPGVSGAKPSSEATQGFAPSRRAFAPSAADGAVTLEWEVLP